VRQIGNHDFPAIGEQGPCGRKANPGGATGDDCHPAIGHCALPVFVNAPGFAAGLDALLAAALHRIPRHKSASKSRYFKGLGISIESRQ